MHEGQRGRSLNRILSRRVGVFLYVSVSISDWHDRIASSLMERVRGSLLLSDEEGGSDEPVDFLMLLHRFERVQPGEALNVAMHRFTSHASQQHLDVRLVHGQCESTRGVDKPHPLLRQV